MNSNSEPSSRRVWGQRPGRLSKMLFRFHMQGDILMSFVDKTLTCKDCGAEFIFSAGEQEFYAEKGFENEPIRCRACREARKQNREGSNYQPREMYEVVCAECGVTTQVPFQPRNDRPVYCRECFNARKR